MSFHTFGERNALVGELIESVISESFIFKGELVSSANVVFFKVRDYWVRVVLDAGTLHWKSQHEEPVPWSVPEEDWSYPHTNIGNDLGLPSVVASEVISDGEDSSLRLEFVFSNGRRLVLFNKNDSSSYHVA